MKVKVQKSPVEGRGLFAAATFKRDEFIIEYTGPYVDSELPLFARRKHILLFALDDGRMIDGVKCKARFANHSCTPNMKLDERDGHVFFHAKRLIQPGEELFIDYNLDTCGTQLYVCHCGTPKCRGYLNSSSDIRLFKKFQRT